MYSSSSASITFIPVSDLKGLSKGSQIAVVGDAVVEDLTGNENITYDQVAAVNKLPMKPDQRRGNPQ